MRVICINNKPINGAANGHLDLLEEGVAYTSIKEDEKSYVLREIFGREKNGYIIGFRKERFVPCSEIDETELVNELVNVNA